MLGDRDDAASRLVGALSSNDPPHDVREYPSSDDVHRYRAVVSALLDVRPDHVGGYFDEALDAALAANRVDVHLARTLRWWQRASVRAAEDFVAQIIPTVMAALDEADVTAERDAAANATAWQQAQAIAELSPAVSRSSENDSSENDSAENDRAENDGRQHDSAENDRADSDEADDVSEAGDAVRWRTPVRLVAVPDLATHQVKPRAATPARRATRMRSARMPDFDGPIAEIAIDEIDSMMTFEREEARAHAHPASSA